MRGGEPVDPPRMPKTIHDIISDLISVFDSKSLHYLDINYVGLILMINYFRDLWKINCLVSANTRKPFTNSSLILKNWNVSTNKSKSPLSLRTATLNTPWKLFALDGNNLSPQVFTVFLTANFAIRGP